MLRTILSAQFEDGRVDRSRVAHCAQHDGVQALATDADDQTL